MIQAQWRLSRIERLQAEALDIILNVPHAAGKSDEAAIIAAIPFAHGNTLDRLDRYGRAAETGLLPREPRVKTVSRVEAAAKRTRIDGCTEIGLTRGTKRSRFIRVAPPRGWPGVRDDGQRTGPFGNVSGKRAEGGGKPRGGDEGRGAPRPLIA